MLKSALFGCICLLGTLSLSAKQWTFAKAVGDSSGNTAIHSVAPYDNDHILIAGAFSARTLKLGSFELVNSGQTDAFVALLNKQGEYLWATRIGGSGEDVARAAVADDAGNIYVAGSFKSLTLTVGTFTLINQGDWDGFVIRFNPDKSVAYANRTGAQFKDDILDLKIGKEGHLYAAGQSVNNLFTPSERVYIMKYNRSGTLMWQRTGTNTVASLEATSLTLDADDNSYLVGGFNGRLGFEGGISLNSSSGSSGFLVKYNANGNFVQAVADNKVDRFNDITLSSTGIAVCGEKKQYGIGWGWPLSDSKIYVTAFNPQLSKLWEKTAGGLLPLQSLDLATAITTDPSGNIYVCGKFQGRVIPFAGDSIFNILNKDYFYEQGFLLRFSPSGQELFATAMGAELNDGGTAILALSPTEVWMGGQFESEKLELGEFNFYNQGSLREVYVHLKPPRFSRNTVAFLAQLSTMPLGVRQGLAMLPSKVYPNPVSHQLYIELEESQESVHLEIISSEGQTVWSEHEATQNLKIAVDVQKLPPGAYWLWLRSGDRVAVHRWIKL
jgi:hypothetical protein